MIIELKTARAWQIWIDGVCPTREWSIGEAEEVGEGDREETFYRYNVGQYKSILEPVIEPLEIAGRRMEWIAFDIPDSDWSMDIDWTRIGPTLAYVKFEGDELPIRLVVTECWYLSEYDAGPAPKGVQLVNGVWLEIDEVTAYVRLETEATE